MPVLDYATVRARLRWFAWPTLLSAALFAHFLVSVSAWVLWFAGILRNPSTRNMRGQFIQLLLPSAPAFILCGLSGVFFVLALRDRAVARRGVLFVLIAAIAFFLIDIYFGNWQIYTFIATREYWNSGGRRHDYFTWWWYNDRWFD